MLRIAVCDDAVEICYEMERIILSVADKFSIPAVCEHYYTGEKLCRDLKSHEGFDLIFLDIELSDMSGIDIARLIRNEINDEFQQIVFISSKKQYSLELHSFHPLDFIVKPIDPDYTEIIFKRFLKLRGEYSDDFKFKVSRDYRSIRLRDIKYLTVANRLVYIVMRDDKTIEFYGTLEKAYEEQLKKHDFLFLHKQFIVNPMYISIFEYDKVILTDGKSIPIGSSKRKEIRAYQLKHSVRGND